MIELKIQRSNNSKMSFAIKMRGYWFSTLSLKNFRTP